MNQMLCKVSGGTGSTQGYGGEPSEALDTYRLQIYQYAVAYQRLGYPLYYGPYPPRLALRQDEPKPQYSYIGLIAMAILSSPETKLVLSDIYQYILDHYPYFRTRGPGWRNSIRHNLSLNDCFVKAGRSANGKGHYWAIHPANVDDFKKGDFRRRKAQRKVRRHMGLAVDEEDSPPSSPRPPQFWVPPPAHVSRRRQFDVESLLAPDTDDEVKPSISVSDDEVIDVVSTQPVWPIDLHKYYFTQHVTE